MGDLVERLRTRKKVPPVYSGQIVRSTGPDTPPASVSSPQPYPTALVNPDGPEAADEIERLRARVAELEAFAREVAGV